MHENTSLTYIPLHKQALISRSEFFWKEYVKLCFILETTIHHFLLFEGTKCFPLSLSESPSSKCCCFSKEFQCTVFAQVVIKPPIFAVAVYLHYMILPCAAECLRQTYGGNEGCMTLGLSQRLLTRCLEKCYPKLIFYIIYLFTYFLIHSSFFFFADTAAMQFVISGIPHQQVVTQQLTNSH